MKVLRFPSTAGFKKYKPFFSKESVSHPAKINLKLLEYIIKTYTEEGDIVLDPMAGTFSTPVLASLLGRDGVGVDLEERFIKMGLANKSLTEKQMSLKKKGSITVIHGDARELSKLLGVVDNVVMSPPYSGKEQKSKRSRGWGPWNLLKQKEGFTQEKPKSEPYEYSTSKGNIGNLKYKKPDVIISSPPYEASVSDNKEGPSAGGREEKYGRWKKGTAKKQSYTQNGESIKVDTIISSPPYAHESSAAKMTKLEEQGLFKMGHSAEQKYAEEDYRFKKNKAKGNIGKMKLFKRVPCSKEDAEFHDTRPERKDTEWEYTKEIKIEVDTIISSPPYEKSVSAENDPERRAERMRQAGLDPKTIVGGKARCGEIQWKYSEDKKVDVVVTSPPYSDTRAFHDLDFMKSIAEDQTQKLRKGEVKGHYRSTEAELRYLEKIDKSKIENKENIGNLKGETYLSAMKKVYSESYKVLKPEGKMVLIVKNFIRNKKVVDLAQDTIDLCISVGFMLAEHVLFKLPTQSFWRILYKKKHPEVDTSDVEHEHVLVFTKQNI